MTTPHQHGHDTAFMVASRGLRHTASRTLAGSKKHAVSISVGAVVSVLTGTFIPMLENHWAAQDGRDAIASAVAPVQKQIDDLKQQQHDSSQALWRAINQKRDK